MEKRTMQAKGLRSVSGLLAGVLLAVPCFAVTPPTPKRVAAVDPLTEDERLLFQGRADDAAAGLRSLLAANPRNDAAHLLLCRVFYAEELTDAAVSECEAALTSLGHSSAAQDWMGRAYGLKADHAGPLAGYKLASKVRVAFETAVQLDPKNPAAVDDLGEYYSGAPSMLGGGTDKANELAARIEAWLPQQAHRIRAMAADKEHDVSKAEAEYKAAVGVGGHADAWFDLGHFYYRQGQKDQAVDALKHSLAVDTAHDDSLVDVASVLVKMKREPALAEKALRDYLASSQKTDAAPAFAAHVALGKLLENRGDKAAAQAEFASALGLAKDYAPAKKAAAHL